MALEIEFAAILLANGMVGTALWYKVGRLEGKVNQYIENNISAKKTG